MSEFCILGNFSEVEHTYINQKCVIGCTNLITFLGCVALLFLNQDSGSLNVNCSQLIEKRRNTQRLLEIKVLAKGNTELKAYTQQ